MLIFYFWRVFVSRIFVEISYLISQDLKSPKSFANFSSNSYIYFRAMIKFCAICGEAWRYILRVSGKLPPGKFPPIKLPPGEFTPEKLPPRKFPPGIFPPMFLNIPTRVFQFFCFFITVTVIIDIT